MAVPKTAALPLGDAPTLRSAGYKARTPSWQSPLAALRAGAADRPAKRRSGLPRPERQSRAAASSSRTGGVSRLRDPNPIAIRPPPDDHRLRSVAQSGSAPRSGRGGRRFKSCHSDHSFPAFGRTPDIPRSGWFHARAVLPALGNLHGRQAFPGFLRPGSIRTFLPFEGASETAAAGRRGGRRIHLSIVPTDLMAWQRRPY